MAAPARYILVVAHTGRADSLTAGIQVCAQLIEAGVTPVLSADERRDLLAADPSLGQLAVLGQDVQPAELELVGG
jgi:NAD+ kinase